jgi:hypothetical protein
MKRPVFHLRSRHYIGLAKKTQEINSHQKSRLGFERGNTSPKNPKQAPTQYEYGRTYVCP